MTWIENRTFEELNVGDSASLQRTLTQNDIELFAIMSGDVNPAHLDAEYAKDDMFHRMIAHGMWGGALISTVLGTELPGPGTIYLNQSLKFSAPVTPGDTITIIVTVIKKHSEKNIVDLECKGTNQNNKVVISGIATVIAPSEKVRRKRIHLPQVILKKTENSWYEKLIQLKNDFSPLKTIVVHPVDALSLTGAIEAAKEGLITPILVGPKEKIELAAKEAHIDLSHYEIIPTKHSHEAAQLAVTLIHQGKAEAIMKGKIHTDELMEPILDKTTGLRTGRRMSHIFSMEVPNYYKPLFLTDAALSIRPTLHEKKDIVQNAIDLFCGLQLGQPKVAILSAIETVNEKIPSTLDATALCKMAERGQIYGGILDGPLAFDNAINVASAREKEIYSQVAGDADILVVPDLESGNMLYKQMTFLSDIESAAIVMGAQVPIILTSRSSSVASRKASSAMALIYLRKTMKAKQN